MSEPPSSSKPDQPNVEEDFATLLAQSEAGTSRRKFEVGDVVSGRVIAVGQSAAFIDLGGKGEATIDLGEFRDPGSGEITLAEGDQIQATVVDDGQRSGNLVLKRSLGRGGGHVSAELEQALAHGIPVEGVVSTEVKGGFEVQIGSIRAFCPGSQIDLRRGGERVPGSEYVGQRFSFRVTKVENHGRNVVVSRRELLAQEAAAEAAKTWESIRVGAVLSGRVTALRDFGAFVDLGGVEGLIHISEIGYGRVKHPEDALAVGQPVEVQVIKVSDEPDARGRRQIGLSLKALAADPWSTAAERFAVGSAVRGVVRRVEGFGAFVEIAPGVEGLVHVSKLVLDRRVAHPRQVVSVGQEVEVTVLAIDPEQRRLSLSMVESAREAKETAAAGERREQDAIVAETNQQTSFGSLADLLAAERDKS